MIYVSKDRIQEMEYLISQSIQGHHILFEPQWLKNALEHSINHPFSEEEAYAVEPHIEKIIELATFREKRHYLEELEPQTLKKVIRTYFHIVENNLLENGKDRH